MQPVLYDLISFSACLAIALGIHWNRPTDVRPWLFMFSGQVLFLCGDLVWNYYEYVDHVAAPSPSAADALYLAGYPLLFVGLWLLIRKHSVRGFEAREGLIDSVIAAAAIGAVIWMGLISSEESQILRSPAAFVAVLYPIMDIFLVGILARMLFSSGRRESSFYLLNLSAWCLVASDIAYAKLLSQAGSLAGSFTSAGWLLAYVMLGTAALHPSSRAVIASTSSRAGRFRKSRIWELAALGLIPSMFTLAAGAAGVRIKSSEIAVASAMILGLIILRMSFLIREAQLGTVHKSQLASIVDSAEDTIISFLPDRTITSWNLAATHMYGFTAEEAIGSTVWALLIPEGEIDDTSDLIRRVFGGELISGIERHRWRKDHQRIDVSLTLSPMLDESGRIIGASSIARDVTLDRRNSRQLKDAYARYRLLVEQVPLIIYNWRVSASIAGVIENYVSPQIETILGFDAEKWMADPSFWNTRIHPDDRERVIAATLRSVEEAAPFDMEYRMIANDGRVVWLRDQAVVLERDEEGKASLLQGVQQDISVEKLAEDSKRERAEEKEQLVEILAHELITPVTSIQAAALTLSSVGERLGPDELEFISQGVAKGARRLRRLVDNIRTVARVNDADAAVYRESVQIGEVLRHALQDLDRLSEIPKLSLMIDPALASLPVVADLQLAVRAFKAVIENALDYAGDANVEVDLRESDGCLLLRVSDRGPGVPSTERDHIFDLFAQVDSTDTRGHEGLGVGLYLARSIMRLLEGDLECSARPGGGTTFELRFALSSNE